METALIIAIFGVSGTVFASLLAVGGTLWSQYMTNRREANRLDYEREKLTQERELKELDLQHAREFKRLQQEHERQEKRREERLKAYRDFYAAITSTMPEQLESMLKLLPKDQQVEATLRKADQLLQALAEIYIVAPLPIHNAAAQLHDVVMQGSNRDQEEYEALRLAYIVLVKAELGVTTEQFTNKKDEGI